MRVTSFLTAGALVVSASGTTLPTIKTSQGRLRGSVSNFRSGATVYKGIPYAAAPVDDLRWKEPQAASSWEGVLNATEFGPQCAQPTGGSAGIFSSGKTATSEDCLTLNVWTPTYKHTSDIKSKNLPVYVWIFGGRFEGGSADVKTYDGSGLAVKDVIVVTLNYRLGAFGFLAHPELSEESGHNSSGNYGILDQQFALRWVQNNIKNFGGNPDQVVVGGQSAGSASSLSIMYSALTEGLVNGVIAESGARYPKDPMTGGLATSHRNMSGALSQGKDFVENSLNVSTIAEARKLSSEVLINYGQLMDTTFDGTVFENLTSAFMNPPLWRPVVDGYVLPYGYGESLRLNAHLDVPILTGNNKDESGAAVNTATTVADYTADFSEMFQNYSSSFLELWPVTDDTSAGNQTNSFFRDLSRVSAWLWGNAWAAGGAKSDVYVYYWTHTPAENPSSGAYHGSELWYTFNNIPYASYDNATWTDEDYEIEEKMAQYWVNFISTGNPNGDGSSNLTYFPPSTSDKKQAMWLGDSWGADYITESDEQLAFLESWLSILFEWLRRKKCSDEQPHCANCLRNGILCTWPEPGNAKHAELLRRTNPTHRATKSAGALSTVTVSTPSDVAPASPPLPGDSTDSIMELLRLVPRPLDPQMLMGNLRRPVSKRLFYHYLHRTNKAIAICQGTRNPFVADLIPMAMSNDLILDGLLACSGIHYADLAGGPVEPTTWLHYGQAIQGQKFGLTRLAEGQDHLLVPLLVTAMLLCIVESFRADSGAFALHHLRAASVLLKKVLKLPDSQIGEETRSFLLERYAYTMTLAHITMGSESDQWVIDDSALLFPAIQTSPSSGCVHELFQLIPRVSIIARQWIAESRSGVVSDDTIIEHEMLQFTVASWLPESDDEIHCLCGRLYQQALLVYLASSSASYMDTRPGYTPQVQDAFDNFIPLIESIPPDSSISTTLCWPLAIFGSCARTIEHRGAISRRLGVLSSVYSAQSVRDTKTLLETLWKEDDPKLANPLSLERMMKEEGTTVLFF
ncbi:hypothetical protein G7Z17_g1055 [Cylindrodendrum hubeiense]|uniref:Acetylcholinesterase n=1 Tax=Cylindrodendrum hubeiense TaxID=595255 RepID=A0A9P5LFP6_9HYPO|nr:hypothetical protein G7Z17_g1055 [Cylindrodendrum hubeiense]